MTRTRGIATDVLEHEYVYSDPELSISDLAEKHGLARSGVAAKVKAGGWVEKRDEFRRQVTAKARDALAEKWASYETANREKLMTVAARYLDLYTEALDNGEIKVTTKDMLGIAAMQMANLDRLIAKPRDQVIVSEGEELSPEEAAAAVASIREEIRTRALLAAGDD